MTFERLGPYKVVRKLGEGGMGAVYLGVQENTGQQVAVKMLPDSLARQPGFRLRFESEIETLRKLEHPHIVRLLGFGEEQGHLFYSMEYVAGRSLQDELDDGKRFTWHQVVEMGIQLCKALKHAHDRGIIHRDIKPANIMCTPDGKVKLTDFGIARLYGMTGTTMAGSPVGTANYMAPEQTDGSQVTERADLYALGGTFYALLAGRTPFVAQSLMQLLHMQKYEDPEPVGVHAPDVPRELEVIVTSLLKKKPEDRLPSATMLSRSLQAVREAVELRQTAGGERPPSTPALGAAEPRTADTPHRPATPGTMDRAAAQMLGLGRTSGDALDDTLATRPGNDPGQTHAGGGVTAAAARHVDADVTLARPAPPEPPAPPVPSTPPKPDAATGPAADATLASPHSAVSADGPTLHSDAGHMATSRASGPAPGPVSRPPLRRPAAAPEPEAAHAEPQAPETLFITAEEAAEEDRRRAEQIERTRPTIVNTGTVALVLFLLLGVPLVWWLMRPASADDLLADIRQAKLRADEGSDEAAEEADRLIRAFEARFPEEPRLEELAQIQDELEIRQLSPLQRSYRQALAYQRANEPARALMTLRAMLALYGNDKSMDLRRAEERTLVKAQNLAQRLEKLVQKIADAETPLLQDRLERAKSSSPARARQMAQAIIELYGDKPWAASQVEEARRLLDALPPAAATAPAP